jgi:hypothetical protein
MTDSAATTDNWPRQCNWFRSNKISHKISHAMAVYRITAVGIAMVWLQSVAAPSLLAQVVSTANPLPPERLGEIAAQAVAEAIPRGYDRTKDWGRTRKITTGVRSSGNFFKFDIHRQKSDVNHGVWKHYRVVLVEPEKNLRVRIENLRSLETGRVAFTLFVSTKLHGWARAKVYEYGVHLGAYEAEGDATVRLWIDGEIAIEAAPAEYLVGIAVRPHVSNARLAIDDFHVTRISDVSGPIVRELGDSLRGVIEDEINGPKLVEKLNRSIEKRRDRLVFTPEMLIGAAKGDP